MPSRRVPSQLPPASSLAWAGGFAAALALLGALDATGHVGCGLASRAVAYGTIA